MRGVFVRGAVIAAVVVSLVSPAQARPLDDWAWSGKGSRIVKVIKGWVAKTFGDDMSVPKP